MSNSKETRIKPLNIDEITAKAYNSIDNEQFLLDCLEKVLAILRNNKISDDSKVRTALSEASAGYGTIKAKANFKKYGTALQGLDDEIEFEN